MKKSKVALVKCKTYDRESVETAIEKAIELLGGIDYIMGERDGLPALSRDTEIVLKPNMLAKSEPEKAVTTHPEVFRGVGALLQKKGYSNLKYGDSPGNPMLSVEKTAETCGIKEVADQLGISLGDFDHGTEVAFPEGKTTNKFVLCNEIARIIEKDEKGVPKGALINICKMKTHQLERITGALKNSFGCVFGLNKSATHAQYATPEHFARMIADLNRLVAPRLHIMDGIVAMEGNGPMSGTPVPMYTVLASTDPVALDAVFCHLVNLDTDLVPTNVAAAESGIGFYHNKDVDVILSRVPMQKEGACIRLDEAGLKYGNPQFNVQRSIEYRGTFKILRLLSGFLEKKPILLPEKCVGCGVCVEACPVEGKAIKLVDTGDRRVAMYNYEKCIKCYCCQEMCPKEAISVKKSILARIADRRWKI